MVGLGGSVLRPDDTRLTTILDAPGVHNLRDWRPSYSVFHCNNRYLNFRPADSSYTPDTLSHPIAVALDELLTVSEPFTAEVRLQDIDSLVASRSNTEDNRHRWPDMTSFGRWSFFEHLPDTVGGTTDRALARDWLIEVLRAKIIPGGGEFGSIRNQLWCDRRCARNSGISRRLAALSYLASTGDRAVGEPFVATTRDEDIDAARLADIEKLAATFVLIAPRAIHNTLIQSFNLLAVPVATFGLAGLAPDVAVPHLYCLLNVDAGAPHLGRNSTDGNLALYRQQRRLRTVLERYTSNGTFSTLSDYTRHVCASLRP